MTMDDTTTGAVVTLLVTGALIIMWMGYEWYTSERERARQDAAANRERLQRIGQDAKALCAASQAEPIRVPVRRQPSAMRAQPLSHAPQQHQQTINSNKPLLDALGITTDSTPPGQAAQQRQQQRWEAIRAQWADMPPEWH